MRVKTAIFLSNLFVLSLTLVTCIFLSSTQVYAEQSNYTNNIISDPPSLSNQPEGITNPAVPKQLGNSYTEASTGKTFSYYFVYIWRVILIIGGLLVVMNIISGAVDWITAGGEKGKVESARNKITGSVVGLIILVGSFAAVQFIGNIIQLNLLNPTLKPPGS